jgi:hypothetical protein
VRQQYVHPGVNQSAARVNADNAAQARNRYYQQHNPQPSSGRVVTRQQTNPQTNVTVQNGAFRNRPGNPVVTNGRSAQIAAQSNGNTRWGNNWNRGNQNNSRNWSWADAQRNRQRGHHDRDWWRSRYNRFALFGGGYYYWDNNYWYPAYGYDPSYDTYVYDAPVYSYNALPPSQVIANVQTELQRQGYYPYAVDGLMGPMTRAAIANFQRDHNLAITSAIDEPTLQELGLV